MGRRIVVGRHAGSGAAVDRAVVRRADRNRSARSRKGGIWTQPGQADYTLGIALGYGREKSGRVGHAVGFNAYPLFQTKTAYIASGATITKTGETYSFACTQDHWSMEGRPVVREANLEQYREHTDLVAEMNGEEPPGGARSMYPNPFDTNKDMGKPAGHHQWGMAVDLSACVGCG